MKILPLEPKDFGALSSVRDIDFSDAWNLSMLESAQKSGNFFGFTVKDGEKILAFITFSAISDGVDIEDVYTFAEYRKNGYAGALIEKVISFAKEKSIPKIFLEVKETNEKAIKLYQKFGFKTISQRKKYYADGNTALVMLREI